MVVENGEVALFERPDKVAVLVRGGKEKMNFVDLLLDDVGRVVGSAGSSGEAAMEAETLESTWVAEAACEGDIWPHAAVARIHEASK